jgi:hypothetical protein
MCSCLRHHSYWVSSAAAAAALESPEQHLQQMQQQQQQHIEGHMGPGCSSSSDGMLPMRSLKNSALNCHVLRMNWGWMLCLSSS